MNILLIDTFFEDSHRQWAEGLGKHSVHDIQLLTLSPHHWKWRMTGGTVELANKFNTAGNKYDLIIATDMVDLATFKGITSQLSHDIPTILYFHENQISYPWKSDRTQINKERDRHYGFLNYTSAIAADNLAFNSQYHQNIFLEELNNFLSILPGNEYKSTLPKLSAKSAILPIGLDLDLKNNNLESNKAVFIWNHRWEHDKNPETFFKILFSLKELKYDFEVIIVGKKYPKYPAIFDEAKERLHSNITHMGYCDSREEYHRLLIRANILMVTSNQDFFGISAVEAIHSGCYPLLPDRLAFPEHLPDGFDHHLYQSDENLLGMAREVIDEKKFLRVSPAIAEQTQKYNWSNLISKYDQYFDLCARKEMQ